MFSQVVDEAIAESGRQDQPLRIASHMNASIRELQSRAFFYADGIEDQYAVTDPEMQFLQWTLPRLFRQFLNVEYMMITGRKITPRGLRPNPSMKDLKYFYYTLNNYTIFSGLEQGMIIKFAYYSYSPLFTYYPVGARPATYDWDNDTWSYAPEYDTDDTKREEARKLTGYWILKDWKYMPKEGTFAKLWKAVGDHDRSRSAFALFKSYQDDLLANVGHQGPVAQGEADDR